MQTIFSVKTPVLSLHLPCPEMHLLIKFLCITRNQYHISRSKKNYLVSGFLTTPLKGGG